MKKKLQNAKDFENAKAFVKDFFLTSLTFDIGSSLGNEVGVIVIDLSIIVFKLGLAIDFNFTSIIGFATAYYILRYFR